MTATDFVTGGSHFVIKELPQWFYFIKLVGSLEKNYNNNNNNVEIKAAGIKTSWRLDAKNTGFPLALSVCRLNAPAVLRAPQADS